MAEMLTLLLLHPDAEYTLSEVAGKLGLPLTTVQREANRFSDAGLIRERHVGRSRLASANPASRYTRQLTELVSLALGPMFVIGEEFQALNAIAVAIYGSWAARYEGTAGHAPNDVDVLVIGDAPRRGMYEAAEQAEQRLGLPVNPVVCSLHRWFAAADPLIQQIRTAPLVWVIGEEPREGEGWCAGARRGHGGAPARRWAHRAGARSAGRRGILARPGAARPRSGTGPHGCGT